MRDIRKSTEEYFRESWSVEKYIKKLLPFELEYMKKNEGIKALPTDVLVQLVGFSWDPLLISLCVYKPKKLVMVLNKFYGKKEGAALGENYIEHINKLQKEGLINDLPVYRPQPFKTVKDTPAGVFQFLQDNVLEYINEGKKVVIDITGAKKTMVAGAYLFAGFAGAVVSYLDFKEYNKEYGKPYGYTCMISKPEDPMELFKIREWERVRQQYNAYAFGSALEIVEDIEAGTRQLIKEEETGSIGHLKKCLRFYETWDNGDYRAARRKYRELVKAGVEIECPLAVERLWEIWYCKDDIKATVGNLEGLNDIKKSIYVNDGFILVYAGDELKRIKRLIEYKEDYRSALLRAAGLNEFLLKARIVKMWVNNQMVVKMNGQSYLREGLKELETLKDVDKGILTFSGVSHMVKALRWEPAKKNRVLKLSVSEKETVVAHCRDANKRVGKFWRKIKSELSLPDDVFDLRNKAIHFCLSIPKDVAEVAVAMAERNLEEFQSRWSSLEHVPDGTYDKMDWDRLVQSCGIQFLPGQKRGKPSE